jgi:3-hydroxy-3-methylglutaryl CoA synthase
MNGNHIFDSPYSASRGFDSSLRHSAGSKLLHSNDDVILTNDFTHQAFHQPNTRKVTKITPSMFEEKTKFSQSFSLNYRRESFNIK